MSARHIISAAVLVNLFFVLPVFAAEFVSEPKKGLFEEHAIQTQHFQFEYSDIVGDQADEDGDGIRILLKSLRRQQNTVGRRLSKIGVMKIPFLEALLP